MSKQYTTKQMGDACEMLVAGELTLAGVPALTVPDNWPHYDILAQPKNSEPVCISVKSRTYNKGASFVNYNYYDQFDWLAIVLLPADLTGERLIYIVPRHAADAHARQNKPSTKTADKRYYRISEIPEKFKKYKNNFDLSKK